MEIVTTLGKPIVDYLKSGHCVIDVEEISDPRQFYEKYLNTY